MEAPLASPMESAQERQGRELAALRHDLLTPLNQIIGYSELLEEEAAEAYPAAVTDLHHIQQAAATLVGLIRTRLQLASSPESAVAPLACQLPPAEAPQPAEAERSDPSDPAPRGEPSGELARHGRILAVDDDSLNRDMLASRLIRQGHSVTVATDGLEVLEKMRQQRFDLVLLDVIMPHLDGYGTLVRLKADEELRHVPVIMISALDDISSVVRCIEAGAEDYLPKPFNSTLLRARIGACLEKKALRDQEMQLYKNLVLSQQGLERELRRAEACVAHLPGEVRHDPHVGPLLAAFQRMTGALSRQETALRATIKELEIQINSTALEGQVCSILEDPSFVSLAERARAMRQRRASQSDA